MIFPSNKYAFKKFCIIRLFSRWKIIWTLRCLKNFSFHFEKTKFFSEFEAHSMEKYSEYTNTSYFYCNNVSESLISISRYVDSNLKIQHIWICSRLRIEGKMALIGQLERECWCYLYIIHPQFTEIPNLMDIHAPSKRNALESRCVSRLQFFLSTPWNNKQR